MTTDIPRQKLCEIIARYGQSVCDDPRRCEGLLRDFCGGHRREIHALVNALKEKVAEDLLASSEGSPREVLVARLTKRLQDNLGLDRKIALWAVESWGLALGKLSNDELKIEPERRIRRRRPKAAVPVTPSKEPEGSSDRVNTEAKPEGDEEKKLETKPSAAKPFLLGAAVILFLVFLWAVIPSRVPPPTPPPPPAPAPAPPPPAVPRNTLTRSVSPLCIGRSIELDSRMRSGTLTDSSCEAPLRIGKKADLYTFSGTQGQKAKILLSSAAFDAYLILVDPDGRVVEDDDTAGERNAFIERELSTSGTYTIQATTEAGGQRGDYTLFVSSCFTVKPIRPGQISGSLTSVDCEVAGRKSKAELFFFNARAGQRVTIAMNKSNESPSLDPFLILVGPEGTIKEDDDGGNDLNARIDNLGLPSNGTYVIWATSADAYDPKTNKGTGKYTLTLALN
jgi:hypothetical protein